MPHKDINVKRAQERERYYKRKAHAESRILEAKHEDKIPEIMARMVSVSISANKTE